MLKSIDPVLNADVLHALRAMGHGDDLVICDTNFPADAVSVPHACRRRRRPPADPEFQVRLLPELEGHRAAVT